MSKYYQVWFEAVRGEGVKHEYDLWEDVKNTTHIKDVNSKVINAKMVEDGNGLSITLEGRKPIKIDYSEAQLIFLLLSTNDTVKYKFKEVTDSHEVNSVSLF